MAGRDIGNAIGSELNEWRSPVLEFNGTESPDFKSNSKLRGLVFSDYNWETCTTAVDKALATVWKSLKTVTQRKYPEISLYTGFVRQGSSREGLKVTQPDEFDCVIEFTVEGLSFTEMPVWSDGQSIPGHMYISVNKSYKDLQLICPNLYREGVFRDHEEDIILDTQNLLTKVFTSLFESCLSKVKNDIPLKSEMFDMLKRKAAPPTFCFKFEINHAEGEDPFMLMNQAGTVVFESARWTSTKKIIEFDLVPALILERDKVPNPYTVRTGKVQYMDCVRYAVMKWINGKIINSQYQNVETQAIWRESTCGYEKHIFDVSRRNVSQRYLMTACRVLKSYLRYLEPYSPSNQLLKVITTYRLKNLCIHGILLLTIPSSEKKLSGVKEALGYMIAFLQMSLERQYLPHFYYGNIYLLQMFPDSLQILESEKLDLFSDVVRDTLIQASKSLPQLLKDLNGLYIDKNMLSPTVLRQYSELLD